MRLHSGAFNRTWLAVIGVVLLILAAGVLLSTSGLGGNLLTGWPGTEARPLASAGAVLALAWVPVVVIVVALLLAAFAIAWLVKQFPRKLAAPALKFHRDARSGVTVMDSSVLATAIADDAEGLANVTKAVAVIRGSRSAPELVLKVSVDERADVREVVDGLSENVLPNAAVALDAPLRSAEVEIVFTRESKSKNHVQVA